MARRIAQSSVNWTSLAERVPPAQKPSFLAFKGKSDKYLRSVLMNPESAPKLDWAFYKARVPIAGMVDKFQKEYETLKIAFPADTVSSQIDAQAAEVKKEIEAFKVSSEARIAQYKSQIKHLESLLPYEMMTMEDFADAHPDLALDPLNKPTYWPHNPEEQLGYHDENAPADPHH